MRGNKFDLLTFQMDSYKKCFISSGAKTTTEIPLRLHLLHQILQHKVSVLCIWFTCTISIAPTVYESHCLTADE